MWFMTNARMVHGHTCWGKYDKVVVQSDKYRKDHNHILYIYINIYIYISVYGKLAS